MPPRDGSGPGVSSSAAGVATPMTDTAAMPAPSAPSAPEAPSGPHRGSLAGLTPVLLVRAAHPRQAVLTAVAMAAAAALSGRAAREIALVLVTVLVGQAVLGWDNDRVDEPVDRAAHRT